VNTQAQTIIHTVGYITGGIVLVAGVLVITGYIVPSYVPENFRIIAGVVLILYGLYRPAMIYIKSKNAERADE
jgi:cytochrome c biogenesis protein CcdA